MFPKVWEMANPQPERNWVKFKDLGLLWGHIRTLTSYPISFCGNFSAVAIFLKRRFSKQHSLYTYMYVPFSPKHFTGVLCDSSHKRDFLKIWKFQKLKFNTAANEKMKIANTSVSWKWLIISRENGNLELGATSRIYMGYIWPRSVQGDIGVIQSICLKWPWTRKQLTVGWHRGKFGTQGVVKSSIYGLPLTL